MGLYVSDRLAEPWDAVTQGQVARWRLAHPWARCSDKTARALAWLWLTFGDAGRAR